MTRSDRPPGDRGSSGDKRGLRPVAGDRSGKPRGMERLGDLLPRAAREFGLEDQLEQARAAAAWLEIVAERIPAAAGACRLAELRQGVATIETDEPIVAQEVRLRAPELLVALRAATQTPVRQLRVATRHV
jgi:predicted nucleic acid-binding Zn ribbon protein